MAILQATASKVWGSLITSTKAWWSELNARDKLVVFVVVIVVGIIGYQHFALKQATRDVNNLKVQIASMATKQQLDALDGKINQVQKDAAEAKAMSDQARATAQDLTTKLNQPFKSTGMKSDEIVKAFKALVH